MLGLHTDMLVYTAIHTLTQCRQQSVETGVRAWQQWIPECVHVTVLAHGLASDVLGVCMSSLLLYIKVL